MSQARSCGGYSEAELQKLLEEQCSSTMLQRRDNAQELIAATQAVLSRQHAAWSAACAAMGQLLTQLNGAHDSHKEGHDGMTTGIKRALETTKQVLPARLDSATWTYATAAGFACITVSQLSKHCILPACHLMLQLEFSVLYSCVI